MPDLLACPQFASKLATLTFAEKAGSVSASASLASPKTEAIVAI